MLTSALGRDTVTPPANVEIETVKDSVISDRSSSTIVNTGLADVESELSVKVCLVPEKSSISVQMKSFSHNRPAKNSHSSCTCGTSRGEGETNVDVSLQISTKEPKPDSHIACTFIHCICWLQKSNVDH